MSKNKNPLNQDEKDRQAFQPKRVEPVLESDKFTKDEQKAIVEMVLADAEHGRLAAAEWRKQKEKDLQQLAGAKPSEIEGLTKKDWMSDRNLNIVAASVDIHQSTLLATCFNPDSIHFKDTEKNDANNKDNIEKFAKWMVGPSELNLFPEVDDHIANRVGLGWGVFKIGWEVEYVWVDKRVPKPSKTDPRRIIGYDIKTEERRFERGFIRNIDELDDILIPEYGDDIHKLPFFIEILHLRLDQLEEYADRGRIVNFSEKLKKMLDGKGASKNVTNDKLRKIEEDKLGASRVSTGSSSDGRIGTHDILEYYGYFKKNGKRELYRFWVEENTETFLAGQPLRKITRDGKIPYEGGPYRRRPGFVRGGSLPGLIADCSNALNNVFNQKSDFQYVTNCPTGYYDKNDDSLDSSIRDFEAGLLKPVDGNPNDIIFFPNMQRSMAWATQDEQFLLGMIERLTGAASYFLTSDSPDSTATRDQIVEEKGQVKFGLIVKRIQADLATCINRCLSFYQDWAPPDLGTRVIGEDGKSIIKNLSIDSLRGQFDCYMVPDITNGSKSFERQVAIWAFQALQGSVWFDPRINPRGNWLLVEMAMKRQGIANPEHFLPPQPKDKMDYSKEAQAHFDQMKQGDKPEPPGEQDPRIVECFATFNRLKETKYHELDEEYRPNFDAYFFQAAINYRKYTQMVAIEKAATVIAMNAVRNVEGMQAVKQPTNSPAPFKAPDAATPQNPTAVV